jgi:sulfate permease, SulP family
MRDSEKYSANKKGCLSGADVKPPHVLHTKKQGLSSILWDISGAFGDIGVLLPIAIVLIAKNGFNPTALFLCAGIFYMASARYFRITMPVQPLKAMSAIAIAAGLNYQVMNAAGVVIGVILLLLAVTGLSVRLGSYFPVPVIRGIQLGLGMLLVRSSFGLLQSDVYIAVLSGTILFAGIFLVKGLPPLIPLLAIGLVFSLRGTNITGIGPEAITFMVPGFEDLWKAATLLVLPQLGLTFGNAIVATEATGKLLYGARAERLTLKSIPLSMGLANIASGIFGGAPMCHGCGGITAHHSFGARGKQSGYIIGLAFIALALLFGNSVLSLVSGFPAGILGILLCYVGIQHALFIRDIAEDKTSFGIALCVAIAGYASNNLSIGFLLGLGVYYSLPVIRRTFKDRFCTK